MDAKNFRIIKGGKIETSEWVIWGIILGFCLVLLSVAIIFYIFKYKKEKRQVLTVSKIPIFGMFLAIFIIQAYFTRIFPHSEELIPFSLDDVTVITIGFIFGPLEAILFGAIADPLRTLINGWAFQILPFFIFPLTGLFAGFFGESYRKKQQTNNYNKKLTYMGFQYTIIIFVLFSAEAVLFVSQEFTKANIITYLSLSILFFILIEWIFIVKQKNENIDKIYLLFMITLAVIITRIITGYIIRPYSQHFYYGYDFRASVIERIFTSSYLVPSKIFFSYIFIDASFYVLNLK